MACGLKYATALLVLYFLIATTNAKCREFAHTGQNTITCSVPDQKDAGPR